MYFYDPSQYKLPAINKVQQNNLYNDPSFI